MFTLKKSCCCYSLHHGAVVIGMVFMISSAVAILMEVGLLIEWRDVKLSIRDKRMQTFVQPLLIVSTVLSAIYLGFSILLLKGIKQKDKKKVLPWLVWSILYIIILLPCAIYELTLGGKILEVTIVPIFYLIIFGCWVYCILCIWAYFKTLPKRPPVRRQSQFFMDLSGTLPRIFPHNKWEDSSASGIGLTNRPHYSDEAAAEVVYDYLIGTRV